MEIFCVFQFLSNSTALNRSILLKLLLSPSKSTVVFMFQFLIGLKWCFHKNFPASPKLSLFPICENVLTSSFDKAASNFASEFLPYLLSIPVVTICLFLGVISNLTGAKFPL